MPSSLFVKGVLKFPDEAKSIIPSEYSVKGNIKRLKIALIAAVNDLKVEGVWRTTGGLNKDNF